MRACQFAQANNSIVFFETGAGKTLVAMLLMKKILSKSSKKRIFTFIVNNKVLLSQQSRAIEAFFKANQMKHVKVQMVKSTNGGRYKSMKKCRRMFAESSIFVIMDEILLGILRKGFIRIEEIDLMIFDECHHASLLHKYNLLIKEFYLEKFIINLSHEKKQKIPKILGLTASPVKTKIKNKDVTLFFNSNFCRLKS